MVATGWGKPQDFELKFLWVIFEVFLHNLKKEQRNLKQSLYFDSPWSLPASSLEKNNWVWFYSVKYCAIFRTAYINPYIKGAQRYFIPNPCSYFLCFLPPATFFALPLAFFFRYRLVQFYPFSASKFSDSVTFFVGSFYLTWLHKKSLKAGSLNLDLVKRFG